MNAAFTDGWGEPLETLRYGQVLDATLAGLATLVKPVAIFVIFGAFTALAMHRQGLRRSLADRERGEVECH